MSYCVNCGVELDQTCSKCPLCSTPVYNPNQPIDTSTLPPFPAKKGTAEPVKHYEFTILMSIMLSTTSLVCLLLNQFTVKRGHWSLYVVGICCMLWIFFLPVFFPNTVHTIPSLILNGLSISAYLGMISWLHPGQGWYLNIGLPITILGTVAALNYYFFCIRRRSSLIQRTTLLVGSLAFLCVCIELLIHRHYHENLYLSWSAIVLICCVAIDVVLITISFLTGVRAEIRRRMHF